MNASPACKSGLPPSLADEEALLAWVRQGLACRSGGADPGEERRLLQTVQRLRPTLQQALAAAGPADSLRPGEAVAAAEFERALAQCGGHD